MTDTRPAEITRGLEKLPDESRLEFIRRLGQMELETQFDIVDQQRQLNRPDDHPFIRRLQLRLRAIQDEIWCQKALVKMEVRGQSLPQFDKRRN